MHFCGYLDPFSMKTARRLRHTEISDNDFDRSYEDFQRALGLEINREAGNRRAYGIRKIDICAACDITIDYFSNITIGHNNLSMRNFYRLSKVLDVPMEEFIKRAEARLKKR